MSVEHKKTSSLFAFTTICLFLTACAIGVETQPVWSYDGPVNSCKSDNGCPVGFCHADLKICALQPPLEDPTLLIKVTPNPNTGAPSQTFKNIRFDSQGNMTPSNLTIKTPARVNGRLITDEENDLDARTVFIDTGNQIPGHSSLIAVYQYVGQEREFNIDLLPSQYDIIISPKKLMSIQTPVFYANNILIDSEGTMHEWNETFGAWSEMDELVLPTWGYKVKGVVKWDKSPAIGLDVIAIDPVDGSTVSTSGTATNTTGLHDSEPEIEGLQGAFIIRLGKDVTEFSLKITKPNQARHPVFVIPGFTTEGLTEKQTLDLTKEERLIFEPLGIPIRYEATVYRQSQQGGNSSSPAPYSTVLFSSNEISGGEVDLWVEANEAGALEEYPGRLGVNLYPGNYYVTVVPGSSSATSTTDFRPYYSEPLTISSPDSTSIGGQSFVLKERPVVTGQVSVGGDGIPSSILKAIPTDFENDGADGSLVGSAARMSNFTCDDNGEFQIGLDEATYNVVVEAPKESWFAWKIEEVNISIDTSGETEIIYVNGDASENKVLQIELAVPFVAKGRLVSQTSEISDFSGTVVEWFREKEGKAYSIARVVADSTGNFTALLPPN